MSSNVTNNYIQTQGSIQGNSFISTVTTGIQPLKITSQTLVQNLNVEKLGGQVGSYYTNATNIQSGLLGVGYGGTGVTSLTSGYVNFGSSTGILGQSQNLFWDQTNNRLGIGTNTPSQSLNVIGNIQSSSNVSVANQLISSVATGTSPLNIISQTQVSNLNVEKLGGQVGSYYTNATNISTGLLAVSYGGTGISAFTSGYIHFGNSTGIMGQSSNLFWDQVNNRLGIKKQTPQYTIDIDGSVNVSSNFYINGSQFQSLTLSQGYIPFGTGTSYSSTSNLFWDSTNNRLGVNNSSPTGVIDVISATSGTATLNLKGVSTQQFIYPSSNGGVSEICFSTLSNSVSTAWFMGQATNSTSNTFCLYSTTSGNALVVKSNNNVGIGTSSPSQKLEVGGSTGIGGGLWVQANASINNQGLWIGWNKAGDGASYILNQKGLGQAGIKFGEATVSDTYTIGMTLSNAQLGIGTTTPATALDVNGTIRSSSNIIATGGGFYTNSSFSVNQQGAYLMWNKPGGDGATYILNQRGGGEGGIKFGEANTNDTYSISMSLSNGNLGIGTTTPATTLDVSGKLSIRNSSNNQVNLYSTSKISEICYNNSSNINFCTGLGSYNVASNVYTLGNILHINTGTNCVGIGMAAPNVPLFVGSTVVNTYFSYGFLNNNSNAPTGFYGSSYTQNTSIFGQGRIVSGLEFEALSDIRKKQNITSLDIDKELKFIQNLNPILFNWKNSPNSKRQYGFIAQEILKLLNHNELVGLIDEPDICETIDEDGFLSPDKQSFTLDYNGFIPILTKVIQHLITQFDVQNKKQEKFNQYIQQKLNYIEDRFNNLSQI